MNQALAILITLLDQPAVVTAIAGLAVWLVGKLFTARPAWLKYEGLMLAAVKWAEKIIPDDAANKSIRRADAALNQFILLYERNHGASPAPSLVIAVRDALPIVHDHAESEGTL
jgi:hypothetical protein